MWFNAHFNPQSLQSVTIEPFHSRKETKQVFPRMLSYSFWKIQLILVPAFKQS